jgi:hypothetical protein
MIKTTTREEKKGEGRRETLVLVIQKRKITDKEKRS